MSNLWKVLVLVLGSLFLAAGDAHADKKKARDYKKLLAERAVEGRVDVEDLHVVDCLLPGQVRQLGRQTYISPRRPTKTTAKDCRIRGGEYVAYDRADYKTALKVWITAAEAGEADAQNNVGEIFEKGLGGTPNYEAAITWYRRAAAQGSTRAQFNLGTLYEQGLGVPQSTIDALNWYRKAWGIKDDSLVFASAAKEQQEAQLAKLAKDMAAKDAQIQLLQKQLIDLQQTLKQSSQDDSATETQINTLQSIIDVLQTQQAGQQTQLQRLNQMLASRPEVSEPKPRSDDLQLREPTVSERANLVASIGGKEVRYKDLKLGNYYALLIGNADYQNMEDLETPINDVVRAREILENQYGFTVFTLDNGDNIALMQAINDLDSLLEPEDNLLLFYAGHGSRLNAGGQQSGYWLPSNAEQPPRNTYWVANEFITGHLARLQAKRILVVADSCYAGLLSNEPTMLLIGNDASRYDNLDFLEFKLQKRSRLLFASGGDRPVLDNGSDGHSIFAGAFLDALEDNHRLLASPDLFLKVRDRVKQRAAGLGFEQIPELKTIKAAGHEVGDFFFVPAGN